MEVWRLGFCDLWKGKKMKTIIHVLRWLWNLQSFSFMSASWGRIRASFTSVIVYLGGWEVLGRFPWNFLLVFKRYILSPFICFSTTVCSHWTVGRDAWGRGSLYGHGFKTLLGSTCCDRQATVSPLKISLTSAHCWYPRYKMLDRRAEW